MLWLERVEHASKDHLRQQELVSRRDLARHPALHLDNIVSGREAQPTEDPLPVLELVELEDIVNGRDAFLERPDGDGLLELDGVLGVEGGELRGCVEGRIEEKLLKGFDFLADDDGGSESVSSAFK